MLYKRFLNSGDTLWVYQLNHELFKSVKDGLLPLFDLIKRLQPKPKPVIILDKVIGNAAALLSVKASAIEVWSPLGSEPAVETLKRYNIKYHFDKIVPYIQNRSGSDICPMEKLSLSLENITPDQFYETLFLKFPPKPG